jgi:tetratricopeptide (TPR) repeat protein
VRKLISIVLVFVLSSSAWAAEPGSDEAKGHVRQATAAYNLGNYLQAAKEYEAAYYQTLDANLLFNIGQAYRLAGDGDKAITAYRSFIRSAPRSDQRGLAEAKIREIEGQRGAEAPAGAKSPSPPPASAPALTPAVPPSAAAASVAASPPAVAEPAAPAAPGSAFDLSAQAAPAPPTPAPYYKRWPFWTAVGAVVVGTAVVGVVLLGRRGNDLNMGNPSFGTKDY